MSLCDDCDEYYDESVGHDCPNKKKKASFKIFSPDKSDTCMLCKREKNYMNLYFIDRICSKCGKNDDEECKCRKPMKIRFMCDKCIGKSQKYGSFANNIRKPSEPPETLFKVGDKVVINDVFWDFSHDVIGMPERHWSSGIDPYKRKEFEKIVIEQVYLSEEDVDEDELVFYAYYLCEGTQKDKVNKKHFILPHYYLDAAKGRKGSL